MKLHIHQPCLKALGTNTPFFLAYPPSGWSPQVDTQDKNGVSALRAFKTGQVHLVYEAVQILSVKINSRNQMFVNSAMGICSLFSPALQSEQKAGSTQSFVPAQ
jgi:hypothetical protein